MDRNEIRNRIEILIQNSLNGLEVESSKFDFKRKWYNLKDKYQINEFARDTSAIVNTVGVDGFIVIGFDDKSKEFYNAKFGDCGLKDSADLQNLIIKKCSDLFEINSYDFEINGNKISVIHIPPFKFKPVVIPSYETQSKTGEHKHEEQRTFVRKNTRTFYANKVDFDKMYYDRKNVEIEFEYYIDILKIEKHTIPIGRSPNFVHHNRVNLEFIIENLGRRNLSIKGSYIIIKTEKGELELNAIKEINKLGNTIDIKSLIRVIQSQSSETLKLVFTEKESQITLKDEEIKSLTLIMVLSNNKKISKKSEDHGM